MALRLLRGEVLGRAHDRAGLGHVRGPGPGDPEVRHFHVTGVVDDHVVRLEVAVDHAVAVREPRRLEDLDRDVDRPERIERRLLADHLLQRPAGEVFHRDVVGAIEGPAIEHADHVRVLKPRRRLRLAAEALDEPGVLGEADDGAASARPCGRAGHPGRETRRPCRRCPAAGEPCSGRRSRCPRRRSAISARPSACSITGPPTAASGSRSWRSERRPCRRTRPGTYRPSLPRRPSGSRPARRR